MRGGIPRPIENRPEFLSQAVLAGRFLVGRLDPGVRAGQNPGSGSAGTLLVRGELAPRRQELGRVRRIQ